MTKSESDLFLLRKVCNICFIDINYRVCRCSFFCYVKQNQLSVSIFFKLMSIGYSQWQKHLCFLLLFAFLFHVSSNVTDIINGWYAGFMCNDASCKDRTVVKKTKYKKDTRSTNFCRKYSFHVSIWMWSDSSFFTQNLYVQVIYLKTNTFVLAITQGFDKNEQQIDRK